MQEYCIRLIMFGEFRPIRRNNSWQSNQLLNHVPLKSGLFRYTRQAPSGSAQIKITAELKKISLNIDSAMYQTIAIFQESSGFLEWNPISSNSERYIGTLD